MLTSLVIGMVAGVIYGMVAMGIVLIYKGSRVFNFAQGEFATVAMYLLYLFHEAWQVNYALAVLIALLGAIGMGIATERFVVRPLADAPKVISLVGTAGAGLLAIGIQFVVAKPEPRSVSRAVEGFDTQIAGLFVNGQQILSMLTLMAIAAAAALFFQKTFLGMGILATSQDSTAARIVGANTSRINMITWGIAGLLAGIAGILFVPEITLTPGYMTLHILIPAFTAAVVGGMTSLVGAFVGGELVGIIEGVGFYMSDRVPIMKEIPEAPVILLFLLLVVTLAIRPQGLFGTEA